MRLRTTICCLTLALPAALSAEEILTASFAGTPSATVPFTATTALRSGLSYSGWVRGAGVLPRPTENRYGFNVNAPGDHESTLAEAIAEQEYLGFTLTPTAPLDLALTQVTFTVQRDSYHAPRQYAVLSSVGGFAADAPVLFASPHIQSEDSTARQFRFFLPRQGFDQLTGPVEFRLYAYAANYNHPTSLSAWSIATFDGDVYTVTAAAGPGGTATMAPEKELFAAGEVAVFMATPAEGQRFAGWSGTAAGFGNPLTLTISADTSITANFAALPPPRMTVGMNLGSVTDYGSDWPFVDHFRRTRYWMTRSEGGNEYSSGHGAEVPVDANGWPLEVPFTIPGVAEPQIVHTILVEPGPRGQRTMFFEGTGTMRLNPGGSNTMVNATGGGQQRTFNTDGNSAVILDILTSSAADPIRNIHYVVPEDETTFTTEPFHPLYRERLAPFGPLRYMDWQATNAQEIGTWARRSQPGFFTQSLPGGVALEVLADFANLMHRDAWVCIPHAADDDFVRQMARLLRDRVDPALKIYVEYSNETWNTAGPFSQTVYVQDQGVARNLDPDRWRAGQYFAAVRSVEIWRIFREEFGAQADARLVEVLASQNGGAGPTQMRVEALNNPALNPDRIMPKALAVAPYFGIVYRPDMLTAGYPTVDDLATTTSIALIQGLRPGLAADRETTRFQGWKLVCYEGGQHFVGGAGAENDQTLTDILIATNRDPRMYDRYTEYLDMLQEEGVELFESFSYVSDPGKYGSWGALEYQEQPPAEAPKYRALADWIARQAQADSGEGWVVK